MENLWNSIKDWITNFIETIGPVPTAILKVILIVVAAKLFIVIVTAIIKRTLYRKTRKAPGSLAAKKSETVATLITSASKYIVYFIGIIAVLDAIGLGATIGSVIATAGIGGIALSLGAQSFIKDVVAGFFILLEDEFAVGDLIEICGKMGTVESISLRTTRMRLATNEIVAVPNGLIDLVTNYTRDSYTLPYAASIAYDEDEERAAALIMEAASELADKEESILEAPKYLGISHSGADSIEVKIALKVKPQDQWQIERDLNAAVIRTFKKNGIKLPQHTNVTVHNK